jgi:hypothetical protein
MVARDVASWPCPMSRVAYLHTRSHGVQTLTFIELQVSEPSYQ